MEKKIVRNPEIVWRVEKRREAAVLEALEAGEDVSERGTVILIISGMMHQLNLVGGRIWTLLDGSRGVEEVTAELAGEFDAGPDEVRGDVQAFVDDLLRRGWVSYV